MSLIGLTDNIYAFRFLWLLTRKWTDLPAYELGIIDVSGNPIKKYKDLLKSDEKSAYTKFHRLVFSIKRLLEKAPFGKSRLANYAAALYLIKEDKEISKEEMDFLVLHLKNNFGIEEDLSESQSKYHSSLYPGIYISKIPLLSKMNGNEVGPSGSTIKVISSRSNPVDKIGDIYIYEGIHLESKQIVPFTLESIRRKVK